MKLRGFTLIELLVTMAIMTLITSVTLANHSEFGGKVLLRSAAYEMALAVREAQTYGVSVRKINIEAGEFESAYGIHFDASDPTHYVMFTDTYAHNGMLVRGEGRLRNTYLEDVTTYTIGRGYKINKLCAGTGGSCVNVCDTCSGSLDITFKRPEPDASIRFAGSTSNVYDKAEVELISPRGDTIKMLVEVSGQISVIK